jgi:WD40 repeat protein
MSKWGANEPSRRDALVRLSAAAVGGSLLAGRAAGGVPPVASRRTSVVVLAADTLKPVHNLVGRATEFRDDGPVPTPAFSPEGKLVACGGAHTYAGIWDVATGRRVAELGHCDALAFRPTGDLVTAVASYDGRQGECATWAPGAKEPAILFRHLLEAPRFSPDGRFLTGRAYSADLRRTVHYLMAVPDGKSGGSVPEDDHYDTLAAVLPGGDRAVIGKWSNKESRPGHYYIRDVESGKVVAEVGGFAPLAVSADGRTIAARGADPAEVLVRDSKSRTTNAVKHGHAELSAVGLSADGTRLATAGPKLAPPKGEYGFPASPVPQVVTVWDLSTRRSTATAEVGDVRWDFLVFSPDGKLLLAAGSEIVVGRDYGPKPPGPGGR